MLAVGIALFACAISYIDVSTLRETVQRLAIALPAVLLVSGLWHLARTWAWASCFRQPGQVEFWRLARVRLSAEAFSYLTFGGIVGDPLKVALLSESIDAETAAAAVALERCAYVAGTTIIVGIGALVAMTSLPLTPFWFRVFSGCAIGAGALAVLGGVAVAARLRWTDTVLTPLIGKGRVARFTSAVARQMLDVVRSSPARLAVLMAAIGVSYLLMALEMYVIVRTSAPFSASGALAAETLSRVASFASSFIPSNLGALEASSLATVAAVGVTGAGAALAVARRLRGMFWAGVGLALYPRDASRRPRRPSSDATRNEGATLIYFPLTPALPVPASAKLAGLPIAERVVRSAFRGGYARVLIWFPEADAETALTRQLRALVREYGGRVLVTTVPRNWDVVMESLDPRDSVTIVGAGTVLSPALLASAREIPAEAGHRIDVPAGPAWPESGILRMTAGDAVDRDHVGRELAARFWREVPQPSGVDVSQRRAMLAIRIADAAQLAAAEATIRRASYKDTDAKIARFNRRISLPISVALIPTPLTANQLSLMLVAVGFYSAWLFSLGHYWTGILAAFLSLAASVLDGCDGEIARLKYQESALGCWIETVGDYSYYVAIFAGLTVGAVRQSGWEGFYWLGATALAGTLLSFGILIFLRARITGGEPERLHAIARARFKAAPTFWSRVIWRVSFVATRAAMPYGIMALALIYALPEVVVLAAIGANLYWISLAMKTRDLLGRYEAVAVS